MKLRYRIGAQSIYFVWSIFLGFKVYNRKYIPKKGGFIVAPNHLTNYDPPLVGAAMSNREAFYFAKEGLFVVNPFSAWFLRYFNAFRVKRDGIDKEAIRHTENLLKRGLGIVMFPEGTRSRKGTLKDMKSGAGYIAARVNVPVIPAYLHHVNTPLLLQVLRKRRPAVMFGEAIYPDAYTGKIRERADAIAAEIRQSIIKLSKEFN